MQAKKSKVAEKREDSLAGIFARMCQTFPTDYTYERDVQLA